MTRTWIDRARAAWSRDGALLRRGARNVSIGLGGSMASVVLGLGRTALLTKNLTLDDYGRLLIVVNLPVFLTAFFGLRVKDLVHRFYPGFTEAGDEDAAAALLGLSLLLDLALHALLAGAMIVGAGWMARALYADPDLANLIRLYAVTVVIGAAGGIATPLLRLWDEFGKVVGPQVVGNAVVLVALGAYFVRGAGYEMIEIVGVMAAGAAIASAIPAGIVLRRGVIRLASLDPRSWRRSLRGHGAAIRSTLLHTNLAAYFKVLFSPGDVFLLGVLGRPDAVAIYGLARQLTAPLMIVYHNVQAALTPEILRLHAERKFVELKRLVSYSVVPAALGGGLVVVAAILLARPAVLLLAKPEYLASLPVFNLLLVSLWVSATVIAFYPLGLSFDLLGWFNLANLVGLAVFAIVALYVDTFTAMTMAYLRLAVVLIRRVGGNLPVIARLRGTPAP